jgi:hypothetical protein
MRKDKENRFRAPRESTESLLLLFLTFNPRAIYSDPLRFICFTLATKNSNDFRKADKGKIMSRLLIINLLCHYNDFYPAIIFLMQ